ncbi:MAG: hypothetical protein AAF810_26345 [Cyanobacteria bacterium P01_D01_bin.36]
MAIQTGDLVVVTYEDREFTAIVIDPNGLGEGEPSVGFGFRMAERHIGIPRQTLSDRVAGIAGAELFKTPSGKAFRVSEIRGSDGNDYKVIEVADWVELSMDILLSPGKMRKPTREKIGAFLIWFAIKGFYAEANVAIKGVYTGKSSRATTRWLIQRQSGKPIRKTYTDLLLELNVHSTAYGQWTNTVYKGLFGMPAAEMKQKWELMSGNSRIARNYINEEDGLAAVKFAEDMVVRMYIDDLEEAHREAIRLTVRKFNLHPQFWS